MGAFVDSLPDKCRLRMMGLPRAVLSFLGFSFVLVWVPPVPPYWLAIVTAYRSTYANILST